MLSFTVNGTPRTYDNSRLMFSEAMELQKATGLNAKAFEVGLQEGDTLAYAALFWIAEIRALAAERGLSFRDAVKELPFSGWDVNLTESIRSVRRVEEPDPTPAPADPSGPPETTFPDTSAPASPETTSPVDATPTSEPSPSSSESAPGSGTS